MSEKIAFIIQRSGTPELDKRATEMNETVIDPACNKAGYKPIRAAQVRNGDLGKPILSPLYMAPLVIADLGSPPWDPDQLIQLGFRLSTGRPIVLLSESKSAESLSMLPPHLREHIQLISRGAPPLDQQKNLIENQQSDLIEKIETALADSSFWDSHYPCVDFRVPLPFTKKAIAEFTYANESAATLYGLESPDQVIGQQVKTLDDKLLAFMPEAHRQEFQTDRHRWMNVVTNPAEMDPTASVPAWFTTHTKEHNHRVYLPILVQHKFDMDRRASSVAMRVVYVEVGKWQLKAEKEYRDISQVLRIPAMFRLKDYKWDAFLSYNTEDQQYVKDLADTLHKHFGMTAWFDQSNLAGGDVVKNLKAGIDNSLCFAAVVGPGGLGRWQTDELSDLLIKLFKGTKPCLSLILPNADGTPNEDWDKNLPAAIRDELTKILYLHLPNRERLRQFDEDSFLKRFVCFYAETLRTLARV
jgi:hypothetical protein